MNGKYNEIWYPLNESFLDFNDNKTGKKILSVVSTILLIIFLAGLIGLVAALVKGSPKTNKRPFKISNEVLPWKAKPEWINVPPENTFPVWILRNTKGIIMGSRKFVWAPSENPQNIQIYQGWSDDDALALWRQNQSVPIGNGLIPVWINDINKLDAAGIIWQPGINVYPIFVPLLSDIVFDKKEIYPFWEINTNIENEESIMKENFDPPRGWILIYVTNIDTIDKKKIPWQNIKLPEIFLVWPDLDPNYPIESEEISDEEISDFDQDGGKILGPKIWEKVWISYGLHNLANELDLWFYPFIIDPNKYPKQNLFWMPVETYNIIDLDNDGVIWQPTDKDIYKRQFVNSLNYILELFFINNNFKIDQPLEDINKIFKNIKNLPNIIKSLQIPTKESDINKFLRKAYSIIQIGKDIEKYNVTAYIYYDKNADIKNLPGYEKIWIPQWGKEEFNPTKIAPEWPTNYFLAYATSFVELNNLGITWRYELQSVPWKAKDEWINQNFPFNFNSEPIWIKKNTENMEIRSGEFRWGQNASIIKKSIRILSGWTDNEALKLWQKNQSYLTDKNVIPVWIDYKDKKRLNDADIIWYDAFIVKPVFIPLLYRDSTLYDNEFIHFWDISYDHDDNMMKELFNPPKGWILAYITNVNVLHKHDIPWQNITAPFESFIQWPNNIPLHPVKQPQTINYPNIIFDDSESSEEFNSEELNFDFSVNVWISSGLCNYEHSKLWTDNCDNFVDDRYDCCMNYGLWIPVIATNIVDLYDAGIIWHPIEEDFDLKLIKDAFDYAVYSNDLERDDMKVPIFFQNSLKEIKEEFFSLKKNNYGTFELYFLNKIKNEFDVFKNNNKNIPCIIKNLNISKFNHGSMIKKSDIINILKKIYSVIEIEMSDNIYRYEENVYIYYKNYDEIKSDPGYLDVWIPAWGINNFDESDFLPGWPKHFILACATNFNDLHGLTWQYVTKSNTIIFEPKSNLLLSPDRKFKETVLIMSNIVNKKYGEKNIWTSKNITSNYGSIQWTLVEATSISDLNEAGIIWQPTSKAQSDKYIKKMAGGTQKYLQIKTLSKQFVPDFSHQTPSELSTKFESFKKIFPDLPDEFKLLSVPEMESEKTLFIERINRLINSHLPKLIKMFNNYDEKTINIAINQIKLN